MAVARKREKERERERGRETESKKDSATENRVNPSDDLSH